MSKSKQIGTGVETDAVNYAVPRGFPDAERLALKGANDPGDIRLCPEVIIESKGGKSAEKASEEQVNKWLDETEVERRNSKASVGFLVRKRAGYGKVRAGHWYAHIRLNQLRCLLNVDLPSDQGDVAITLKYSDALRLLRHVGYGEPLPETPTP